MNLRQRLLKAGIKPRDLREAVQSARELTEQTEEYAEIAENMLSRLATHPRLGKKTRLVVVTAAKVAATMKMAASGMLVERKRK